MMDLRATMKQNIALGVACIAVLTFLFIYIAVNQGNSVKPNTLHATKVTTVPSKTTVVPAKEVAQTFKLSYKKAPDDNPLKGFVGLDGTAGYTDFPSSMEFILIPMSALVVGEDQYDWKAIEEKLLKVNAYGRQGIISLYLDYPGSSIGTGAIPKYLLDQGLKIYPYDKYLGGFSPDYSNEELWKMIYKFVEAFAKKYDGDGRIGAIEASIVGIWGEWHTYPYTTFGLDNADLVELARVYSREFKYTQVAYRYPFKGMEELRGGYSDYSFCHQSVIDEWSQLKKLQRAGVTEPWNKYMCGGELYPPYRDEIFETKDWSMREGESYEECIDALRPSWLLVGNLTSFTMAEREQAIKAANRLGYEFYMSSVSYDPYLEKSIKDMTISVNIKNLGIAPFYYNWPVTLEFINSSGNVVLTHMTDWNITEIAADGKNHKFKTTVNISKLKKGTYQVALRIKNPLSNGNPLRFANETQHKDGLMMIAQMGYGTTDKFTKDLVEPDPNELLEKTYGWSVTSSYLRDHIGHGHEYVFGLRFRKIKPDAASINYDMSIKLYKSGKLVRTIKTTWNLASIKGDTAYLAWSTKTLEPGEYVMKLKIAKDIGEIDFGHLVVKK